MVQSGKVTPAEASERVHAFLEGFQSTLEDMPADKFEEHKAALIATKLQKSNSLEDEVAKHWCEVEQQRLCFHSNVTAANFIKIISQPQLVDWYKKHLVPSSPDSRELVVLVPSVKSAEVSNPAGSSCEVGEFYCTAAKHDDFKRINSLLREEFNHYRFQG